MPRCYLAALFLCSFLLPLSCWSQSQNASLSGQVTDASGASIPNAAVSISSSERQTTMKTNANSDGRYSFPNLPPGSYELSITAPGFQAFVQHGITLTVNQSGEWMRH